MKSFMICVIKAFLVSAAIVVLLMAGMAAVFMLSGTHPPPHFFQEMGGTLGGVLFPVLFFMLSLVFWSRQQHARIVQFQDKQIFMDRLNNEVAKMRLKEERRSDTFLSFKVPFTFSKISVDLSKPGLATLSGIYFPVKTLHERLMRQ